MTSMSWEGLKAVEGRTAVSIGHIGFVRCPVGKAGEGACPFQG